MSPMEGYLAAKRHYCSLKRWKARKFVLNDGILSYYWNKKVDTIKGSFRLTDDTMVEDLGSEGEGLNVFLIMFGYEYTLIVSAPSASAKERWISAIRDEIEAVAMGFARIEHVPAESGYGGLMTMNALLGAGGAATTGIGLEKSISIGPRVFHACSIDAGSDDDMSDLTQSDIWSEPSERIAIQTVGDETAEVKKPVVGWMEGFNRKDDWFETMWDI